MWQLLQRETLAERSDRNAAAQDTPPSGRVPSGRGIAIPRRTVQSATALKRVTVTDV